MTANTKIEWADSTWNPWIGCTKISPACDHCYAEALMDTRMGRVQWGAGKPRSRTSPAYWKQPLRWNARPFWQCPACNWRGDDPLSVGDYLCAHCLHKCELSRRRVFCASLADVFDNEADPVWRADLFDLIRLTPNLDWLLLTKRIGNAQTMIYETRRSVDFDARRELWLFCKTWGNTENVPANIWLGATICNQSEADRDIPKLLATPAAKRFLSIEPMLGSITFRWAAWEPIKADAPTNHLDGLRRLDWIICGGESGPHARQMHPDWARSLRDQCEAAGVPFLFKQWGEWIPAGQRAADAPKVMTREMQMAHEAAGRFSFARLSDGAHISTDVPVWRVGKHAAGRLLDGVEHNGVPA